MNRSGSRDVSVRARRHRSNACDENTGNGQSHTNAQRHDHHVGFGIVAVLERVIPLIEHLRNRRAQADGDDNGDGKTAHGSLSQCSIPTAPNAPPELSN